MLCPYCHNDISENAKFCPKCGNRIEVKAASFDVPHCATCGKELASGASFCPYCGTKVTPSSASTTQVNPEDYCNPSLPRCPRCNTLIRKNDKVCPQCGFKLNYMSHLGAQEKKDFLFFLSSAFAMACCLFPGVSLIISIVNIILLLREKKTTHVKECLIYNIIAMVVAIGLLTISLILMLQSVKNA